MNQCWYYVEGYEDRLFKDSSDACEFIGDMEDFYTDEGLQQMCEEQIYEICGIDELYEYCDNDEDCILEYVTEEEIKEHNKSQHEDEEFDLYYNDKYIK